MSKRIFSRAELEEFEKEFMELAVEALDKGDLDTAKRWCVKNKETEWFLHDAYLIWTAEMLTFVYDCYGENAAAGAIKFATRESREIFEQRRRSLVQKQGLKGHIHFVVDYFWRHRFGSYTISEDDEKVSFTHHPCGSGGRLMDRQTFYKRTVFGSPMGYSCFEKPGPHSWGETGVPNYCSQCAWLHEIYPIEEFGCGGQWWIHESPFPRKPGKVCVHHIYKDPDAIPDHYYERLNIKKRPSNIPAVKDKRLFSDKEISELQKGYMELALEAIESGDVETAKSWCRRFDETKFEMHDSGAVVASAILTYCADRFGEHAAIAVLKYSMRDWADEFLLKPKEAGYKEHGVRWWVEFMVDFWRQHVTPRTVEEDDEKIIFTVKSCGSGGRLVDMKYYETPAAHHRIQKSGFHTWGKAQQPVYCGHCTWLHELYPIYMHGKGAQLWVHPAPYSPDNPGDPCVHYIYKDRSHIPQEYYDRIGMGDWPD